MTTDNQDYVIIWEAPKIVPPEFRLYYDDAGHVVTYTCDKLPGNYIVIDAMTFAIAKQDIMVIDGHISSAQPNAVVYKLMPNEYDGIVCVSEDISIIPDKDYILSGGKTTKWKLNVYEL